MDITLDKKEHQVTEVNITVPCSQKDMDFLITLHNNSKKSLSGSPRINICFKASKRTLTIEIPKIT